VISGVLKLQGWTLHVWTFTDGFLGLDIARLDNEEPEPHIDGLDKDGLVVTGDCQS